MIARLYEFQMHNQKRITLPLLGGSVYAEFVVGREMVNHQLGWTVYQLSEPEARYFVGSHNGRLCCTCEHDRVLGDKLPCRHRRAVMIYSQSVG